MEGGGADIPHFVLNLSTDFKYQLEVSFCLQISRITCRNIIYIVSLFALGCLVTWGRLVLALRGLPLSVTPDSFSFYSLLFHL